MAYLEKRMTGFHEYTPQRPHAAFKLRVRRNICATYAEQMLRAAGIGNEATVHCVMIVCC